VLQAYRKRGKNVLGLVLGFRSGVLSRIQTVSVCVCCVCVCVCMHTFVPPPPTHTHTTVSDAREGAICTCPHSISSRNTCSCSRNTSSNGTSSRKAHTRGRLTHAHTHTCSRGTSSRMAAARLDRHHSESTLSSDFMLKGFRAY